MPVIERSCEFKSRWAHHLKMYKYYDIIFIQDKDKTHITICVFITGCKSAVDGDIWGIEVAGSNPVTPATSPLNGVMYHSFPMLWKRPIQQILLFT